MSRGLWLALILSLILHSSIAFYFLAYKKGSQGSTKKGIISVDFIQPVAHSSGRPAAPKLEPGQKKAATQTQSAPSSNQVENIGDPNANQQAQSNAYIEAVTRLINARKVYPRAALDREEEGRVVIGVTVNRQGQILSANLEEKTHFDSLNRATLETVHAVGTFPPLPIELSDPIHLHIPLIFKVER